MLGFVVMTIRLVDLSSGERQEVVIECHRVLLTADRIYALDGLGRAERLADRRRATELHAIWERDGRAFDYVTVDGAEQR